MGECLPPGVRVLLRLFRNKYKKNTSNGKWVCFCTMTVYDLIIDVGKCRQIQVEIVLLCAILSPILRMRLN